MSEFIIRPLDATTWPAFEKLALKHNGVWGGCWCTWFHATNAERHATGEGNHNFKERMVIEGKAHAALVFDGENAIAWAEYGSPAELPNIYHLKEYKAGLVKEPDYRITCFFVDRDFRRKGISAVALNGALDLIAKAGGGTVEAYPRDTQGKKMSATFLYNGTKTLFERAGFTFDRQKGPFNTVMVKMVSPA